MIINANHSRIKETYNQPIPVKYHPLPATTCVPSVVVTNAV